MSPEDIVQRMSYQGGAHGEVGSMGLHQARWCNADDRQALAD